jgi:hypothetical protein
MGRGAALLAFAVGAVGMLVAVLPPGDWLAACPSIVREWRSSWPWGAAGGGAAAAAAASAASPGAGLREWTAAELAAHDGSDPAKPILLGMGGDVFDVTEKGRQFYGPGAPYALFAGRDATRALALGSLDDGDLARGGDVADFDDRQRAALREQHDFYLGKYPRVGRIAPAPAGGEPAAGVEAPG